MARSTNDLAQEIETFRSLQESLPEQFRLIFPKRGAPRTVVIVPSLSLDQEVMAKISGVIHYEERMLCLLLLLRMPRTRIVYVTSQPIPPAIVDYYLRLLSGIRPEHARRRLTMLCCHDGAAQPLTGKILARPRMVARLRQAIPDPASAHITCFAVSNMERTLAVRLGIPIYGCDPDLQYIGSKSGSRTLLREAGLEVPPGFEDLVDTKQVAEALTALKGENPTLRRAVVKLNEGFSGEGNAIFRFNDAPQGLDAGLAAWVRTRVPKMAFEARGMSWDTYSAKIGEMGAIVEAFIEGRQKRSPSAQYRVDPLGAIEVISTHDQVTGGRAGQVFLGCRFPADNAYRLAIQDQGLKAAEALRRSGVLGRFGVDFVSVRTGSRWRHYGVEVNLRKGGTTHPFLMLQFLTDGSYDTDTGLFHTRAGEPRFYFASDNVESPQYSRLMPEDLMDVAIEHGLHYDDGTQQGVVFHLMGALSGYGKVGVVCVGDSLAVADGLYAKTIEMLDEESRHAT